jgi:predicted adenylyl cyclase CyaB
MPRNVEVKIHLDDLESIRVRALALGAVDHGSIHQVDTYFATPSGHGTRLKLREQDPGRNELLAYRRPDTAGLRTSDYRLSAVTDSTALREALALALGVARQVVKRRHVFLLGRTRIHLDCVEGLGNFLELEVVLADGEETARGEQEAEEILARFALGARPRIPGSYADL